MAIKNDVQGVVLALFGASAGGNLAPLTAAATKANLAQVTNSLSAVTGLILGKDLSSDAAFVDSFLANLGVTSTSASYAAAKTWATTSLATMDRGSVVSAAVTFLAGLTDTTNAYYSVASAFNAKVAAAVTWSEGAGATVLTVAALRAQQGNVDVVPGGTFTLTTATESVFGTSGNDTFAASVSSTAANSTLNSGDIIVDSSTTDNDSLNIASTAATIDTSSATIAGIENVNANFTTFGTGVVNAGGVKNGTLTLNQLQSGANGNATANGTVGSLTIKGGTNITGTLTVDNITAGSAVVVDAGTAATVTTTTAGTKGSTTITGGAKTGTATAVADTIKVTVSKAAATVNIDGVTASKAAATVVYGESATIANGAAAAVGTLDISSSFAATSTKTATATLTTAAAATSYNFSGANDQELKGSSAFFDGKTITDGSTAKSTLNLTTLAGDVDLSKAAVDAVKLSARVQLNAPFPWLIRLLSTWLLMWVPTA